MTAGLLLLTGGRGRRLGGPKHLRPHPAGGSWGGHLAGVFAAVFPGGPVQVRGVNSIQAVNDGKRWRILEILWLAETRGETVPAKYLP